MEENFHHTAQEEKRKIPKNIRQIGITETGKAVYIEDYVITFLNKLSKEDKPSVQIAILLGNHERGGNRQTYIEGAICVTQEAFDAGEKLVFSKNMWTDVLEKMNKIFPQLDVVGWYLATSVWNLFEEQALRIHKEHFPAKEDIFFCRDVIEKEEKIFRIENGAFEPQGGYYIYYEKNIPMQEYMVQYFGEQKKETAVESDKAAQQFRKMVYEKEKKGNKGKRKLGFSYAFPVFGLLVVFAVGMSVLDNYEKITSIEETVKNLTSQVSGMAVSATTDGEAAMKTQNTITFEHVEDTIIPSTDTVNSKQDKQQGENENKVAIENLGTPGIQLQEETEYNNTEAAQPEVEEKQQDMQEEKNETQAMKEQQVYIVEPGDTLEKISLKIYHTSEKVEEICALNQIEDVDKIIAGQKIWLP